MKKNETISIQNVLENNKEEIILNKWDKKLNDYNNYVKEKTVRIACIENISEKILLWSSIALFAGSALALPGINRDEPCLSRA